MKILIFEYVCAGGLGPEPPLSLRDQGRAMLEALLQDLVASPQHAVYTLVDRAHAVAVPPTATTVFNDGRGRAQWLELLAAMDAVLVIAPEDDAILADLCTEVVAAGCASYNCTPEAIRLTADKLALADTLENFGMPVVPARTYAPGSPLPWPDAVIKPRDGAGCADTIRCAVPPPGLEAGRDWVVQPYQAGQAVSFSVLNRGVAPQLLACNTLDCVVEAGALSVPSLRVGGAEGYSGLRTQATDLIERMVYGIPGLSGYFGVDAIWHEGQLFLLEINPRLTLSYVGLSAYLGRNLGLEILAAFEAAA